MSNLLTLDKFVAKYSNLTLTNIIELTKDLNHMTKTNIIDTYDIDTSYIRETELVTVNITTMPELHTNYNNTKHTYSFDIKR